MNVHASPSTLPELNDFLSTFNLKFRRDPFSPSSGSLASGAARSASGGRELATPPSRVVVDHDGSVHGTVLTTNLTK